MNDWLDRRSRIWAALAVVGGVALSIFLEIVEEPNLSLGDILLELLGIVPVVLTSVGVVFLFRAVARQTEEQRSLLHELELAKAQGRRWRSEARTLLDGLGQAIETQFARWNLTEAESGIALLLLKGLSLREISTIRATSERTVRAQAHSLYAKAGLTSRAALSAFFLEDLLAPIETDE